MAPQDSPRTLISIDEAHPFCRVPENDTLFQNYHDTEWGMPVISDRALYEKVCLEGFQSGLSWQTILHKRDAFREAFENFEIDHVATFDERQIDALMLDVGIVRNRRKINSAINNAKRAQALREEFGSLAAFFWQFEPKVRSRPARITQAWLDENPSSPESAAMTKALKQRGWSFVGATTMYALMQACGIVNDHVISCPARQRVAEARATCIARLDRH